MTLVLFGFVETQTAVSILQQIPGNQLLDVITRITWGLFQMDPAEVDSYITLYIASCRPAKLTSSFVPVEMLNLSSHFTSVPVKFHPLFFVC